MNILNPDPAIDTITGVILAGGQSRRMGGQDKGLLKIDGVPMVKYIANILSPQTQYLLVNANRNLDRYRQICQCQIITDTIGGFAGPLAGMASAMQAMPSSLLLTVPCDSPWLADDYAQRMHDALQRHTADICVASDGQRQQPVFALLRSNLLTSVLDYLSQGNHKIDLWYAQHHTVEVDFSDCPDMFLNINTPDDRAAFEQRLRQNMASNY